MKFYKEDLETEVQAKDIEKLVCKSLTDINLKDILNLIDRGIYTEMDYKEKLKYTHGLDAWWLRDIHSKGILAGANSCGSIEALRELGDVLHQRFDGKEELIMARW